MPLITHNAFSIDSYPIRLQRLADAKANVDDVSAEAGLSVEQIAFLQGASDAFVQAQVNVNLERGDRDLAYEGANSKFEIAYEKYMPVKEYLLTIIKGTPQESQVAEGYGITKLAPINYAELRIGIETMKAKHDALTALGDSRVAPATAMDALVEANTNMIKAYDDISKENQESAAAYDALHALYEADSQHLRLIYNLAVIVWGKYSPKMMLLGYAPAVPRPGGGQPSDVTEFNFSFTDPVLTFTWNKPLNTTSSQLVYSMDNKEWEVLLYDDLYEYAYNPPAGVRYYKVRVRNANGFSGWSNTISFEPPEVPA